MAAAPAEELLEHLPQLRICLSCARREPWQPFWQVNLGHTKRQSETAQNELFLGRRRLKGSFWCPRTRFLLEKEGEQSSLEFSQYLVQFQLQYLIGFSRTFHST